MAIIISINLRIQFTKFVVISNLKKFESLQKKSLVKLAMYASSNATSESFCIMYGLQTYWSLLDKWTIYSKTLVVKFHLPFRRFFFDVSDILRTYYNIECSANCSAALVAVALEPVFIPNSKKVPDQLPVCVIGTSEGPEWFQTDSKWVLSTVFLVIQSLVRNLVWDALYVTLTLSCMGSESKKNAHL